MRECTVQVRVAVTRPSARFEPVSPGVILSLPTRIVTWPGTSVPPQPVRETTTLIAPGRPAFGEANCA